MGLRFRALPACTAAFAAWLACGAHLCAAQSPDDADRSLQLRRVVHRFDFDERSLGNYEPAPMHWDRLEGKLFPHFADGRFDENFGRTAPPSLHLSTNGRNVALWYRGPATQVRPNSEYLIVGWIRPDHLAQARACLSAYYLDHRDLPIAGTQEFGRLVGDTGRADSDQEWQRVEIHLPAGPPQARTIGLTAWVVQREVWDHTPRPHRHIEPQDLDAGAWFDDIALYRLPRAVLATSNPSNLFVEPDPAVLKITVADNDAVGLSATFSVWSSDGRLVHETAIPIQTTGRPEPVSVPLTDLGPGLYHSQLDIRTGQEVAVTRRLRFAYLSAEHNRSAGVARPFGVVLDADHRTDPETEFSFLSALSVGAVKYPVWSRTGPGEPAGPQTLDPDRLLHDLVKTRVALTGVLGAPPAGLVQSAGRYARTLLDILGDDPAGWQPHLEAVVAPYVSVFRTWQIGADGDRQTFNDPALPGVLQQVRREMIPLVNTVSLVVPGDVSNAPGDQALPAEEITLRIGSEIHGDWIGPYVKGHRRLNYDRVSAYVEIARPGEYARIPWLGTFAERIIRTRHAAVDTAFVPQLWRTRQTVNGPVAEPDETFIVYRTIVDLLRDLTPGPSLELADGVVALAFYDADQSVLALWDPSAPPEGRTHELQLGSARRQIDLFGRVTPLAEGSDGRRRVRLFPQPVFVDQVGRWLVEFVASAELVPAKVEHSLLPQTHTIRLSNGGKNALTGRVTLVAPTGWEVRPQQFGLRLPPRGQLEQPVRFRYGQTEPAGVKRIVAVVDFETDPACHVEIPLTLELGIRNVDVWGFAFWEGERLVLRHGITNRTSEPLSLRSFATAPGRSRQFRVIPALAPGETLTAEYRFQGATALAGRTVRLGLREVDGPRSHIIELTAP